MLWLIPDGDLTPEQQDAIMAPCDSDLLITGGPGAGKTLILLYRLRFLLKEYPDKKFIFFVYTKSLKYFMQSSFENIGVSFDMIFTFDKWCIDFYEKEINKKTPRKDNAPNFEEIRKKVHAYLKNKKDKEQLYDFAFIDEAQDFSSRDLETFKLLAKHRTIALDIKQQLYSKEQFTNDQVTNKGAYKKFLLKDFRCTNFVTKLASYFIRDEKEKSNFISQQSNCALGRKPTVYFAPSHEQEQEFIAQQIIISLTKGKSVVILLPDNRLTHGYQTAFKNLGLEVALLERRKDPPIDFNDGSPKILTYQQAKGLTFDIVFMPRLDLSAFRYNDKVETLVKLFVGCSRAVEWVCLSSYKKANGEFNWIEPIAKLLKENKSLELIQEVVP